MSINPYGPVSPNIIKAISEAGRFVKQFQQAQASGQPMNSGGTGYPTQQYPQYPAYPQYPQYPQMQNPYAVYGPFISLYYDIVFKINQLQTLMDKEGISGKPDWVDPTAKERHRSNRKAMDFIVEKIQVSDSEEDSNADEDSFHISQDDIDSFQQALEDGDFTRRDLENAMRTYTRRVNDKASDEMMTLMAGLIENESVRPQAFLNAKFLRSLSDERQLLLSQTLGELGVTSPDGEPYTGLIGRVLEGTDQDGQPRVQNFMRDLLFRYYDNYKDAFDTAPGKAVYSMLQLAGLKFDENGEPLPNEEQPFPLEPLLEI